MSESLPILYQRMADLTAPLCGSGSCEFSQRASNQYRCCEKQYCEIARKFAHDKYGEELIPTGNIDLPFMGPEGCVVSPYLRPICTLHVCSVSWSEKSHIENDAQKMNTYLELRQAILDEAKTQGKEPF